MKKKTFRGEIQELRESNLTQSVILSNIFFLFFSGTRHIVVYFKTKH